MPQIPFFNLKKKTPSDGSCLSDSFLFTAVKIKPFQAVCCWSGFSKPLHGDVGKTPASFHRSHTPVPSPSKNQWCSSAMPLPDLRLRAHPLFLALASVGSTFLTNLSSSGFTKLCWGVGRRMEAKAAGKKEGNTVCFWLLYFVQVLFETCCGLLKKSRGWNCSPRVFRDITAGVWSNELIVKLF